MSALDQLDRAGFASVEFPVKSCKVHGKFKLHTHDFPHATGGGAIEKLGRELYKIDMDAIFIDTPLAQAVYPDLWPRGLDTLVQLFEAGKTNGLTVPQIGTIQAVCETWDRSLEAKMRSGETVQLSFREDQSSAFLIENLIDIQSQDLTALAADLGVFAEGLGLSAFDSLLDGIAQIQGFAQILELFAAQMLSKLDGVLGLFFQLDATLPDLQFADNHELIDKFFATWKATTDVRATVAQQTRPVIQYIVPTRMAIGDVARALYGDTKDAADLLCINSVADAYNIPAGTKLRVWSPQLEAG